MSELAERQPEHSTRRGETIILLNEVQEGHMMVLKLSLGKRLLTSPPSLDGKE